MFSPRLYSHSPSLVFFFLAWVWILIVVFRQEMPNGFPKTYSWHGNEIQICKTFLTWKKKEAACGTGFVLFFTIWEYLRFLLSFLNVWDVETKQKKTE